MKDKLNGLKAKVSDKLDDVILSDGFVPGVMTIVATVGISIVGYKCYSYGVRDGMEVMVNFAKALAEKTE